MKEDQQAKLSRITGNARVISVTCLQWGDTGKGKIVDLLMASWADINARGTGGANAGHTVSINSKDYILHIIPSGILHDKEGKINAIGRGVAFDPYILNEELGILNKEGLSYNNLMISGNAKLVIPPQIALDRVHEAWSGKGKIGTTGKGIGPAYEDHAGRRGLVVNDLLNIDILAEKLKKNIREKLRILKSYDSELVSGIMEDRHLGKGRYYRPDEIFNADAIIEDYRRYGEQFRGMIHDVENFLRGQLGKKKILLEGAQGHLLSVDEGGAPHTTSSDCTVPGLVKGVGLRERDVDISFGVVKFPYMTRVGSGPMPTEIGGEKSGEWCNRDGAGREKEKEAFPETDINSPDEFIQGIALRQAGNEYGATTGRPRRVGWLDLPLLRYALQSAGAKIILTKADVLNNAREINICAEHEYQGPDYFYCGKILRAGTRLKIAIPGSEFLRFCRPVYEKFPGWETDISGISEFDGLPEKLKSLVRFVEKSANAEVAAVSTGKDREDTIFI
ncbi:MAG: adenylosuccinate synthetase [Patescibacteria group bacterium]|jgi:adenylosuccinate synthase